MNALPKVYRKEIGHAKEYFKEWHRNFRIRLGCMSLGTEYANAEPIIEKQSKVVSLILILLIFMIKGLMKKLWAKL